MSQRDDHRHPDRMCVFVILGVVIAVTFAGMFWTNHSELKTQQETTNHE